MQKLDKLREIVQSAIDNGWKKGWGENKLCGLSRVDNIFETADDYYLTQADKEAISSGSCLHVIPKNFYIYSDFLEAFFKGSFVYSLEQMSDLELPHDEAISKLYDHLQKNKPVSSKPKLNLVMDKKFRPCDDYSVSDCCKEDYTDFETFLLCHECEKRCNTMSIIEASPYRLEKFLKNINK